MPTIKNAPDGERTPIDGTEAVPLSNSGSTLDWWTSISTIKNYVVEITDALYSAFNHNHSDSNEGGAVAHSVLTNAGTSLHVPTYSSDSSQYLNGKGEWTTPAGLGGSVYDSDVIMQDITTNNADSDNHGFLLKLSMDTTKYLRADGSWQAPPAGGSVYDSDILFSDITTNNSSTSQHGFLPKLSGDSDTYLNGDGEFTTPAGGSGTVFYDRRWVRGSSADSLDDEFRDNSIDVAWARVDDAGHSGYVTWTEAGDSLSLLLANTADAAAELHAYLKADAMSIGDYIQCHLVGGGASSNYPIAGLIIADGNTYGAGVQAYFPYFMTTGSQWNLSRSHWTGFNTRAAFDDFSSAYIGEQLHMRLKYSAANTFEYYYSPDGISWILTGSRSITMTPSHIGIAGSSYGGSTPFVFSFDYFRKNP